MNNTAHTASTHGIGPKLWKTRTLVTNLRDNYQVRGPRNNYPATRRGCPSISVRYGSVKYFLTISIYIRRRPFPRREKSKKFIWEISPISFERATLSESVRVFGCFIYGAVVSSAITSPPLFGIGKKTLGTFSTYFHHHRPFFGADSFNAGEKHAEHG